MSNRITAVLGPTNTGKTFLAVETMLGYESGIFGLILIVVILFEPMGLYGRWLKFKTYFDLFPFYRKDMFRRQKAYLKTERTR